MSCVITIECSPHSLSFLWIVILKFHFSFEIKGQQATSTAQNRTCRKNNNRRKPIAMSASDLAPFVAAVIEDGIAAEMQRKIDELEHKIEDLESTVQDRDNERLLVLVTGYAGTRIYGAHSLKTGCSYSFSDSLWFLDMDVPEKIPCVCPVDERSIKQLEIRVGGIVLLEQFLIADDRYQCFVASFNGGYVPSLCIRIVPSNRSKSPIHTIGARIGLAASTSISMDDNTTFLSLIESFCNAPRERFQLEELLHHFDTLINVNGEQGEGTKLTLTFESIIFRKVSTLGCIELMDKLGIRTGLPFVRT